MSSNTTNTTDSCLNDWFSDTVHLLQHASVVGSPTKDAVLVLDTPVAEDDQQNCVLDLSCLAILALSVQLIALCYYWKGDEPGARGPEQLAEGSSSSATSSSDSLQGQRVLSRYRFILGMVGPALVWYNFDLYGLFVTEMGDTFFPQTGKFSAASTSYATWAVAFLARPVGGVLFGYIGDVYGRVPTLQMSLGLMAGSTFAIGVMPPKSLIGNLATISVILARCLQGLAAGGCGGIPAVYLIECTQPNRRCFVSSLLACGGLTGTWLTSLSAAVVHSVGSDTTLPWRFSFIFAAVLGLIGGWASRNAEESDDYLSAHSSGKAQQHALSGVVFRNWVEILQIVVVLSASTILFFTLFVWMPTYQHDLKPPPTLSSAFTINATVQGGQLVLILFLGFLADYSDYVICYASSIAFLGINAWLVFPYFGRTEAEVILAAYVPLAIAMSACDACTSRWIVELVKDTSVRSTTVGIAYGLMSMIAGGAAPSLATFVVQTSWGLQGIGLYLSGVCVMATIILACRIQQPKASAEHC